MKSIVFFLIAAGLALCFSKCQLAEKNATGNIESFDQGNHAVALSPLDTSLQSYFPLSSQVSTKAFYAGRKFERFWFSGSQTTPATDTLLQLVRNVEAFGLISADYHRSTIDSLLLDSAGIDRINRLDVLLTDAT